MRQTKTTSQRSRIACLSISGILVLSVGALAAVLGYFYFFGTMPRQSPIQETLNGPTVVIQEPAPGSHVTKGDSILFSATAMDDAGVVRIDLWVDDQLAISQSSPDVNGTTPFSLNYPLVATAEGMYALTARAYNSQGLMGESPVHHVTVVGAVAAAEIQELGQYVVQPGDTLENIARRAGTTVDAILAVNPGLTADQVKPGQVIVIPLPKAPPAAAAPGGQPGVQPGNLPGGGQAPGGGNVNVNPNRGAVKNPNPRMTAPDPVQVSAAGDCRVKVTWTDSNNETNYDVLRREPGSSYGLDTGVLGADTTKYVDTVPGSGKYEYEVMASQIDKGGKTIDYVVSQPVSIDVPNTPACQPIPTLMRMIFQPEKFVITAGGYTQGSINLKIGSAGDLPIFRLPQAQNTGVPVGELGSDKYRIETWLPQSRVGKSIVLELVGNGWQNKMPFELGSFTGSHTWDQLTTNMGNEVYQGQGQSAKGSFTLAYKFWMEPWIWGAQGAPPSPVLPAPENVNLKITHKGKGHQLTWDYQTDPLKKYVSGFNIYRQYSCPGNQNTIDWPLVVGRTLPNNPGAKVTSSESITQMPQGCSCSYQVSAFGQGGESKKADLQNPQDCLTFRDKESVTVTFENLTIDANTLPKARNVDIYLWANYFNSRTPTKKKAHLFSGTHNLGAIDFGGQPGNTPITLGMGTGQKLQLGFYLGGICIGDHPPIDAPQGGWVGLDKDYTVSSADGGCKMIVHVKGSAGGQQPAVPPNNPIAQNDPKQPAKPPARSDILKGKKTVTFKNLSTTRTIIGLDIYLASEPGKYWDVIETDNDIMKPGGSFNVPDLEDTQYLYRARYGQLQPGQQNAAITEKASPLTEFAGTAGQVDIKEPEILGGQDTTTVSFKNDSKYTLIGLDIYLATDPNYFVDVITTTNLVIPPNGTQSFPDFKKGETYMYQARYGQVIQGQNAATTEIIGKAVQFKVNGNQVIIPAPPEPPKPDQADLRKLLTLYQQHNDWELIWPDPNFPGPNQICPVICYGYLRVDLNGRFEYWEPDANNKQALVSKGEYTIVAHEPGTKVIAVALTPDQQYAQFAAFSQVYYHYSGDQNLINGLQMLMSVNTASFKEHTVCFGNCSY